jgi:hypothetical protein
MGHPRYVRRGICVEDVQVRWVLIVSLTMS